MSCSCQWYRVCDAGALRAEPLATLMSCAVKMGKIVIESKDTSPRSALHTSKAELLVLLSD